jgi:UDP-3-O-[3-hydroxymyristoyl] glucosamine N-acyltransferase
MLVLHPSTVMDMDSPVGELVSVGADVDVVISVVIGALVLVGKNVLVGVTVQVATAGVEVYTPITTGVGVNIDGVDVAGKNGVGPGKGWMTQPLQADNSSANKIGRMIFFIFSPLYLLYPAW